LRAQSQRTSARLRATLRETAGDRWCSTIHAVKATIAGLSLLSVFLLLASCAGEPERWLVPGQVRALRRKPEWARVQSIAQNEVALQKSDPEYARDAFYRPIAHTNHVWFVRVSGVMGFENGYGVMIKGAYMQGGYPCSGSWDAYDLRIRDSGEVLSFALKRETQSETGWYH
jgi:hypothetical protein